MQVNVLVLSYVASSAIAAGVAGCVWRQRRAPGNRTLTFIMAAVTWWLIANALEAAALDLNVKIIASVVAYPGVMSVPVLFFLFALRWTHQDAWLNRRWHALLWIVPALSCAMAATNSWHHLLWPSVRLDAAWGASAVYEHGPWFYFELAYGYAVAAAGYFALVVAFRRHPGFYSRRFQAALLASGIPILASVAYAAGLNAPLHADLSSIAFTFTGVVAAWAILRAHVLDPVPMAWAALVDMLSDGVLVLGPERRLAALNSSATRLLGIPPSSVGRPVDELLAAFPSLVGVARETRDIETEVRVDDDPAPLDGVDWDAASASSGRWLDVRLNVILDARGRDLGRILLLRDVTERRRMIETIRQLSLTDDLTGLLNRRGFLTLAEQQVLISNRNRSRFWLLFADVDGLKDINDRLGHDAGDEALRAIAGLLRETVFRESDIVARFGGDEFAILAPESSPTGGNDLVDRIDAAVVRERERMTRAFSLSLSVGAVVFDPAHPMSLEALVREADRRMYLTKRARRDIADVPDGTLRAAS